MTATDWEAFIELLRSNTALGRISHAELEAAFDFAAERGYGVKYAEPVQL